MWMCFFRLFIRYLLGYWTQNHSATEAFLYEARKIAEVLRQNCSSCHALKTCSSAVGSVSGLSHFAANLTARDVNKTEPLSQVL
jgi:mono/diheme cytochrome c family protein